METQWIYKNNINTEDSNTKIIDELVLEFNLNKIVATILVNRGIKTIEQAELFLNPSLSNLKDPFVLKDMEKAVERLWTAIQNHEKILIFGDFDADGVTSTSLLVDFLNYIDADVSWYVPHRIKEGYGMQKMHISMVVEQNIDLIITVDCGSSSHEAIKAAKAEDIDVIVTDHHEIPFPIPDCVAIINPKREDCNSHLSHLAGVGVAFYLLMALRKYLRSKKFFAEFEEPNLLDYCDLVALGTIGDMVPLKEENRILSIHGIKVIQKGKRIGLKTLSDVSRVRLESMDSDDIGFRLIPRINAAGRLSHARICVDHLTSKQRVLSSKTSTILDNLNQQRQRIEHEIITDINNKIEKNKKILDKKIIILWDKNWNSSVLGIAASRLARQYSKPAILLSSLNDPFVGSCRSIAAINIHDALSQHAHLLEKFGGHSMAAGVTIKKNNIEKFAESMETYINSNFSISDFQKTITIELSISLDEITFELAKDISRLRPFGTDNPEPLFSCKNVKVISSIIIGRNHRKMILARADKNIENKDIKNGIEALQFNVQDLENLPNYYKKIAFKIKENKFKKHSPQIIIEDL
ncbi:MAG: single-stranded-DNA-specific exonuclease RecJ [Desulfobacteraceae bacterium]|nr:single-stranded-DNA-specific exonuclease RecJ [Desulfobacteraceae bacterium]